MRISHEGGYGDVDNIKFEWEKSLGMPVLYLVYDNEAFDELHMSAEEFVNMVRSAPEEFRLALERSKM